MIKGFVKPSNHDSSEVLRQKCTIEGFDPNAHELLVKDVLKQGLESSHSRKIKICCHLTLGHNYLLTIFIQCILIDLVSIFLLYGLCPKYSCV